MKVTFIGTGTMASTKRANTSFLIDNILFDCGMGTIKQFERLGFHVKDVENLIISHFHADHFFDIPNFIMGKKIRNEINKKTNIIGPVGLKQKTYELMQLAFGKYKLLEEYANLNFIELKDNQIIKLNDYKLTAIKSKHGDTVPNYGYLLEKDNVIIGYTGDTEDLDCVCKMCEKSNYLLADATMSDSGHSHIGLNDLIKLAERFKECKFYAIHRHDYNIQSKNVFLPNDGDSFII